MNLSIHHVTDIQVVDNSHHGTKWIDIRITADGGEAIELTIFSENGRNEVLLEQILRKPLVMPEPKVEVQDEDEIV